MPSVNQPFPAYLQEVAAIVANDLDDFNSSELLPIVTVSPDDSVGKISTDRTDLSTNDAAFNTAHIGPSGQVGIIDDDDGSLTDYRTQMIKFPKSRVTKPLSERRQIVPGLHDKAAQTQAKLLAAALYRRAAGVFSASNFPTLTAAFTSLGDGAAIDSASGTVIQTLQLHMEACEDGNGFAPDRLIIGTRAARAIGRNSTILARMRVTVDQQALPLESVRLLLEDALGLQVVISRARIGSTYIWDSEIAAFTYYGKNPVAPRPTMEGDNAPGFSFPGQSFRARRNPRGRLPISHTSACMVMEAFRSLDGESVITDPNNAAAWAIAMEAEDNFNDLLHAMASVDVPVVDGASARILTNCMT